MPERNLDPTTLTSYLFTLRRMGSYLENVMESTSDVGQTVDLTHDRDNLKKIRDLVEKFGGQVPLSSELELARELEFHAVRAEQIFHLGSMAQDADCLPPSLRDELESDPEPLLAAINLLVTEDAPVQEICDVIYESEKVGWLVQFATPEPRNVTSKGSYSCSWGVYTTKWFYGHDYAALCHQALDWQQQYLSRKLAKVRPTCQANPLTDGPPITVRGPEDKS